MVSEVSKTGGGLHPEPPKKPPRPPREKAGRFFSKAEESLKSTAKATSVARSIGSIVNSFKTISEAANKGLKLTKGVSIALAPFNIYSACKDGVETIKSEHLKNRVLAFFRLIADLDDVTDSVAASCAILYLFKVVSRRVTDWIPIYAIVSFFVGFISLGVAAKSVQESEKLLLDLNYVLKKLDKAKTDPEKAKILGDYLAELEKRAFSLFSKN